MSRFAARVEDSRDAAHRLAFSYDRARRSAHAFARQGTRVEIVVLVDHAVEAEAALREVLPARPWRRARAGSAT